MRYLISLLLIATAFVSALSQQTEQKSLSVTVYNKNLGVVKDNRVIDIKKGISTIKISDVAKGIDATSVHIKLDGTVLEQNYQYDLANLYKILSKYIDKQISLSDDKGNVIKGTLISTSGNQIVLKNSGGGLTMLPKMDNYKLSVPALPEGLITVPTLVWKIEAKKSGKQDVELSYQTQGMGWHAEYIAVLNEDDSKMDFNAWVSIENHSGATYKNAKLKLVAGDVHRVTEEYYNEYMPKMERAYDMAPVEQFKEQAFFEYHIYNLQRPTTIANNETKQISLFETKNVDIDKKYFFTINGMGTDREKENAAVVIEFKNAKENNLGMPLPKGKVRLYKSDGESIEFVGEDRIAHTPKNENIKLKVGEAFDVVGTGKLVTKKKISDKVIEYEYEFKIANRKESDIIVDVESKQWSDWEILYSSHKYEKKDANSVIYRVPVAADSESVLTYRVRIKY
jgi:hypothetical protein